MGRRVYGARIPQSAQSLPYGQRPVMEPGPPSSHSPSFAAKHRSLQLKMSGVPAYGDDVATRTWNVEIINKIIVKLIGLNVHILFCFKIQKENAGLWGFKQLFVNVNIQCQRIKQIVRRNLYAHVSDSYFAFFGSDRKDLDHPKLVYEHTKIKTLDIKLVVCH